MNGNTNQETRMIEMTYCGGKYYASTASPGVRRGLRAVRWLRTLAFAIAYFPLVLLVLLALVVSGRGITEQQTSR